MRIGVLSDTHGRLDPTRAAIRLLREREVELILHCGDIDSPATVRLFTGIPTHFVFGNWDLNRGELLKAMREIGAVGHGEIGRIDLAGRRISWLHGHVRGSRPRLEAGGEMDFVFYGHSHKPKVHQSGKTVVLNPGALHRAKIKTVAVVDLGRGRWEWIEVRDGRTAPGH
jgi:uncharacterized protein